MTLGKTPSNVIPFLVAAIVCDVAAEDPNTGKANLIGLFSHVSVREYPTRRSVSLYIKITDAEGYYPLEIQYVLVNTGEVIGAATEEVEVGDRTDSVDVLMAFPEILIPQPGRYEFRIKVSGMFLGNAVFDAV